MMKEIFARFAELVSDSDFDDILVVCHESPDGDAVGSAWGLAYMLRSLGKRAYAACSDEPGESFEYIVKPAPDFERRHLIAVDTASDALLGSFAGERVDYAIDHHLINTITSNEKLVLADRAACSEIIYELAEYLGFVPDEYFADCIYTGVASDTGCFKYSNVTERTFRIAAALIGYKPGGFSLINKRLFDTKSMKKLKLEAYSIENAELLFDGRVAFIAITEELKKSFQAEHDDLDDIINIIRTIKGVLVAIVAKEKGEGLFKVSVRSDGPSAADFCARFGGGGHKAAAGCSVSGSADTVKDSLIEVLGEML